MSLKSQKCARQLFIRLLGEETALLTGKKEPYFMALCRERGSEGGREKDAGLRSHCLRLLHMKWLPPLLPSLFQSN